MLSAFFKQTTSKEEAPFTDPSQFRDARGRKRKLQTVEAARKISQELEVQNKLMVAVEQAKEAEQHLKTARRVLTMAKAKEEQAQRALVLSEKGETRGIKRKEALILACASEGEIAMAEHEFIREKERLSNKIRKCQRGGSVREDLHPVKRMKMTQLIDLLAKRGEARRGPLFWKDLAEEYQISEHNLKSLVTASGRKLTADKLAERPKGKGRCSS